MYKSYSICSVNNVSSQGSWSENKTAFNVCMPLKAAYVKHSKRAPISEAVLGNVWRCESGIQKIHFSDTPQKQEELYLLTLSSCSASYLSLADSIQNNFRKAKLKKLKWWDFFIPHVWPELNVLQQCTFQNDFYLLVFTSEDETLCEWKYRKKCTFLIFTKQVVCFILINSFYYKNLGYNFLMK